MKKMMKNKEERADLSIISGWIRNGSTVLDLGCGNGELLDYLERNKNVRGAGVEIKLEYIVECIEKGLPVIERDLNQDFRDLEDNTFDYVILSQTIQEVKRPDLLIEEILRIGRYGVISFPNFGNFRIRMELLFNGRMPKSEILPYNWYDTPNIHLLTYSDFTRFCRKRGVRILDSIHLIKNRYKKRIFRPNLFSEGCLVLITREIPNGFAKA